MPIILLQHFVVTEYVCIFAVVDENRSSSKVPWCHEVFINFLPSAFVPRSLNEYDYEIKSYSKGKRGVA